MLNMINSVENAKVRVMLLNIHGDVECKSNSFNSLTSCAIKVRKIRRARLISQELCDAMTARVRERQSIY